MSDDYELQLRKRDWTPIHALALGLGYGVFARIVFGLKVNWLHE